MPKTLFQHAIKIKKLKDVLHSVFHVKSKICPIQFRLALFEELTWAGHIILDNTAKYNKIPIEFLGVFDCT